MAKSFEFPPGGERAGDWAPMLGTENAASYQPCLFSEARVFVIPEIISNISFLFVLVKWHFNTPDELVALRFLYYSRNSAFLSKQLKAVF